MFYHPKLFEFRLQVFYPFYPFFTLGKTGKTQLPRVINIPDDAVLFNDHCNPSEIASTIQSDMNTIVIFFKQRGMILNASKTNFMLFSPSQAPVSIQSEIEIAPLKCAKTMVNGELQMRKIDGKW